MCYSRCDAVALQKIFLYLRLQLSIGCNPEYKYQHLYPLETANCSVEMAVWNTWICSAYWSRLHQIWVNQAHYYLQSSVEKWNWVAGITLQILHWSWLNGRYYPKNKFILGETWQSCHLVIEREKGAGEHLMERPVSVSNLPNVATVEPHYK